MGSWGMHVPKLLLPVACLSLLTLGCLSGSSDQGLAVTPAAPAVRVGEQLALVAEPLEDLSQEPEWEVQETYGGGFLNSRGLQVTYVAPVSAGKYHLILRAGRADGSRLKVLQEILVLPLAQVEPSQARVAPGGTQAFVARMKGLPRNTVLWSVEEAQGGAVSEDGLYKAPQAPGTFHVKATSTLDPEAIAVATVVVE
jgi:hypothetical protein